MVNRSALGFSPKNDGCNILLFVRGGNESTRVYLRRFPAPRI